MEKIDSASTIQLAEHIPFQERLWHVQRIGWVVFALIILAALLGLFGQGPLSSATAESGRLQVDYERFARFESPTTFDLRVAPAASDMTVEVWLSQGYLQQIEVVSISPPPSEVRADNDRLIYVFALHQVGVIAQVTFHVTPLRTGLLLAQAGLTNEQPVQFSQFIYP